MDVEGAELLVLQGAQWVLSALRPVIITEINRHTMARFGYTPTDLVAFLERHGYRLQPIDGEENAVAFP